MIWIERFDGRWERATTLSEALCAPVRAFGVSGTRPREPRPLDPATIRGIPSEDLRRTLSGHRRRPGHPRRLPESKVERCLGLVEAVRNG